MTSKKLTVATVDRIPVTKESKVTTISAMPDETVDPEKGYYHGVYVLLHFNNYDGVYRKEDQAEMNEDPDEEDMEGVRL